MLSDHPTRSLTSGTVEKVNVMVHDVPPRVRAAVEADAVERGTSITNVIGSVVAAHLGLTWEWSNYPFRGTSGESAPWNLRVPVDVRDALRDRADEHGAAMSRLLVAILAAHYGLDIPPTRDRRGLTQTRDEHGRFAERV